MKFGVTDAQLYTGGVPANGLNPAWLAQDSDGDDTNNGEEIAAGTNPFDGSNYISVTSVIRNDAWAELQFPTEPGKLYRIQSTTTLSNPQSWTLQPQADPVQAIGDGGLKVLSVPYVAGAFYRVRVDDVDQDADQLCDWVEEFVNLNPLSGTTVPGVDDSQYVETQLTTPNVVSIEATDPSASEDGPETGTFTIARSFLLMPLDVPLSSAGTAQVNSDYHPSTAIYRCISNRERHRQLSG